MWEGKRPLRAPLDASPWLDDPPVNLRITDPRRKHIHVTAAVYGHLKFLFAIILA